MNIRNLYRTIFLGLFLIVVLTACGGKTSIQKYKELIERKDLNPQITAIEEQKKKLSESLSGDFIPGTLSSLEELRVKNEALKKSINQISLGKDQEIAKLHGYIQDYVKYNDIVLEQSGLLIECYKSLLATTDEAKMEELYSQMIALAREIDDSSGFAETSRRDWVDGITAMEAQNNQ